MGLVSNRFSWPTPYSLYSFGIIGITIFFYCFDLGNINGIRQGTEALYIQISQEMFETNNFLTPIYRQLPHWSKPPLQFWLPFPFYYVAAETNTFLSRLAIACCGMGGILVWGWFLQCLGKVPFLLTFIIFSGSLGFLKFSRTFMMEIPLAIFPSLGLLFFYHYLQHQLRRSFIMGVLFFGLGILVKGPISWVLGAAGLASYCLWAHWRRHEQFWRPSLLFLGISLIIGTIWFTAITLVHGTGVLNYFFLGENLGKFYSRPYSSFVLIEGLLIYAFPWCCFLPLLWQGYRLSQRTSRSVQLSNLYAFLFCNFLCFFLPWFLPNQKSHHYALPALPFFLGLMALTANQVTSQHGNGLRKVKILLLLFQGLCMLVLCLLLTVNAQAILLPGILILLGLFASGYFLWRQHPLPHWAPLLNFAILGIWCWILPSFYLPEVPATVEKLIDPQQSLAIVKRRSYFTEQALGRTVSAISPLEIKDYLQQGYQIILPENILLPYQGQEATTVTIIASWYKWRRKIDRYLIIAALRTRSVRPLQENVFLIRGTKAPGTYHLEAPATN